MPFVRAAAQLPGVTRVLGEVVTSGVSTRMVCQRKRRMAFNIVVLGAVVWFAKW